jgi:peptidoglycan/xylan/chitin deacetylase (PgdA/CDA1 family)
VPTFSLTAVALKRHPELIKEIRKYGVEFAIHGYIHTDYGMMSYPAQKKHLNKAIAVFNRYEIPYTGFRAPFLRINGDTFRAITDLGFTYDSSNSVNWNVINGTEFTKEARREYQRVLDYYDCQKAQKSLALPKTINNFVEIPVSMPDDEIMMERLGITDQEEMSNIWSEILKESYASGELFTIQLHPERISYYENTLSTIINDLKNYNPPIWLATLREITEWWRERENYKFKIEPDGDGKYRIKAECSEQATILVKNAKVNVLTKEWFGDYRTVSDREFLLDSPKQPVISVKPDSSPMAIQLLLSEGYIIETAEKPGDYAVFLDDLANYNQSGETTLINRIEKLDTPLIRFWRWPNQARSAVSVTGDIDAITLTDFMLRILETLFTPGK